MKNYGEFVLHEIVIGGYYGGGNKKYNGMFNMVPNRQYAKAFTLEEDALERANILNKGDYNFIVEQLAPPKSL